MLYVLAQWLTHGRKVDVAVSPPLGKEKGKGSNGTGAANEWDRNGNVVSLIELVPTRSIKVAWQKQSVPQGIDAATVPMPASTKGSCKSCSNSSDCVHATAEATNGGKKRRQSVVATTPTHHVCRTPKKTAPCYITNARTCTVPCSPTCQGLECEEGDPIVVHASTKLLLCVFMYSEGFAS